MNTHVVSLSQPSGGSLRLEADPHRRPPRERGGFAGIHQALRRKRRSLCAVSSGRRPDARRCGGLEPARRAGTHRLSGGGGLKTCPRLSFFSGAAPEKNDKKMKSPDASRRAGVHRSVDGVISDLLTHPRRELSGSGAGLEQHGRGDLAPRPGEGEPDLTRRMDGEAKAQG